MKTKIIFYIFFVIGIVAALLFYCLHENRELNVILISIWFVGGLVCSLNGLILIRESHKNWFYFVCGILLVLGAVAPRL